MTPLIIIVLVFALAEIALRVAEKAKRPDLIIGPRSNPQTIRWHIIKWRGWQLCLHKWLRSDSDRAPHDHKANSWSFVLRGRWREHVYDRNVPLFSREVGPGQIVSRGALIPHRIELHCGTPVWSLWLRAPEIRRWGYWCSNPDGSPRWVDADEYNAAKDYYAHGVSEVDRGCG